jgi:hypothetical protein
VVQLHAFLTSALDGGERSASRPGRFTPGKHWIAGWVDPKAGLKVMAKRKIPALIRYQWRRGKNVFPAPAENRDPAVQPVTQLLN